VASVLSVDVGVATHIGRVREVNEDAFFAGQRVFAVADGMGGHAAGDVASRTALQVLGELDTAHISQEALRVQIRRANDAVVNYGLSHREAAGLGTTIAGIALLQAASPPHWAVFSVGDSRVYLLDHGVFRQLTIDHSEVEELVADGVISRSEARHHPSRHIITRAIGEQPAPALDVMLIPAMLGQRWLITSDGLTSELDDGQIARHLDPGTPAKVAATHLVEVALAAGGRDNVAVIVIDVLDAEEAPDADVGPTRPRSLQVEGAS